MLNKTVNKAVAVPVFSLAAMVAFTVWALLAGPADAARAGERERGVVPAAAKVPTGSCPTHCAASTQKLAAR